MSAEATTSKEPRPEPGSTKPDAILVADGVRRAFGGLVAVNVEHVEFQRGVITALIGPNGAGKTTFFNVLTGFEHRDRGTWQLDGHTVAGLPPHRIAQRGMVRTFQLTKALARMTVLDNMKLAATRQRGEHFLAALVPPAWRPQEVAIEARALGLLEHFQLSRLRDHYAGTLSGGQRKLLEVARALMVEPALLMLDEPMAGVNPALKQSLLGHITELRDQGTTVVFVEHDMDVVTEISDWIVCMAEGEVIAEGRPSAIVANDAVIDAYLGRRHG